MTVTFYLWGDPITSTTGLRKESPKVQDESWDDTWAIVHDNWSTTAERVAIPWNYVVALITPLPSRGVL